jgi:hypothetical protein
MLFPFIDYKKVSFATTASGTVAAHDGTTIYSIEYKSAIIIELTNNDNASNQFIYVPSGGAIDFDITLYASGATADYVGPSTTILNSGQIIKAIGNGDNIDGVLHVFRLPNEIT